MDIFSGNTNERLIKFKSVELLFSRLENSTCTVQGKLSNIEHTESELIKVVKCENDIVAIDCNYGHLKLDTYTKEVKVRKSNRGRKKKEKPIKTRKTQGDASSFNSQITFTILGLVIRDKPITPDKHSIKAEKLIENEKDIEKFIKEYKIKIFRNGQFTIPGILIEDLSDVKKPLLTLCDYFNRMNDVAADDKKVEIINLYSVMRNYKFRILSGRVDIIKLHKYCVDHFQVLLNVRFSDIEEFIYNPSFNGYDSGPNSIGWGSFINNNPNINYSDISISLDSLKTHLKLSKNMKNLFVDFDKVREIIIDMNVDDIYYKITKLVNLVQESYFINFNDSVIKKIIKYSLQEKLKELEKNLSKSKDNMLSYIKYDPEKYPGFLIKVKTPNELNKKKRTTIKIFPSGKVNVDGANNIFEAEYIYYWLNDLFKNNNFIYNNNSNNFDDSDSEFSSDSENEFDF